MTPGVLLGMIAAVGWGAVDFMARFAMSLVGAYRAVFYIQLVGALGLTVCVLLGNDSNPLFSGGDWAPWGWACVVGLLNTVSTLGSFRAFKEGTLAIVAPIAASYPAVAAILARLTGEVLRPTRTAGVVLTMIGVMLAAIVLSNEEGGVTEPAPQEAGGQGASRRALSRGVPWALCAALTQGCTIWVMGFRLVPTVGSTSAVWLLRSSTCVILALAPLLPLAERPSARLPGGRAALLILLMGALDGGAYFAHTQGLSIEQVSIVSVLGSLYGAMTGVFGWLFLKERLGASQWVGFATICAGVVLVSM